MLSMVIPPRLMEDSEAYYLYNRVFVHIYYYVYGISLCWEISVIVNCY